MRTQARCSIRGRLQTFSWPEGAVWVAPASSKEAVTHHGLAEQKEKDYQDDYKQGLSNVAPG
jgi:hypothetical protein